MTDRPTDEHSRSRDLQRRLRGGTRHLRRADAAALAEVDAEDARRLWRAFGFAEEAPEHRAFTDGDVDALRRAAGLASEESLSHETVIALARAIGRSTDRLVSWETETLVHHLADGQGEQARAALVATIEATSGDLEALLLYVWRRRLAETVARICDDSGQVDDRARTVLTVGFADLVSYSHLSHRLGQAGLARLVQRFEALAADVVTAGGGRVVKMIGDEILFTADYPATGALIALSLSERMARDDLVPDVRVGLAHGEVLHSMGDVYGVTVNLAGRLTRLAQPGTVLTDPDTARLLGEQAEFVMFPQRRRHVRGFGALQPVLVTGAGPGSELIRVD